MNANSIIDFIQVFGSTFFIARQQEPCEELNRTILPFDWFFVVIILYLAVLAVVRLQIPAVFSPFQQTLQRKNPKNMFSKMNNSLKDLLFFLFILCAWTAFSLALAEALSFLGFVFPFEPLLFAFVVVFSYFFLKYLLKRISSWIFRMNSLFSEYISLAANTNFVWTLIAFPLIIINHYVDNEHLIWVIGFIFCVNFLQKFVLEWKLFSQKMKLLEVLLYLCTAEVLPLLLCARYVVNNVYKQ
ncbi:MAG: DUF4271 domain-containing protein [Lentimicrobiaceae bacterium]|nr:DUF4271 domain-containing protein [Lentimicrobiaceae bacterium]